MKTSTTHLHRLATSPGSKIAWLFSFPVTKVDFFLTPVASAKGISVSEVLYMIHYMNDDVMFKLEVNN